MYSISDITKVILDLTPDSVKKSLKVSIEKTLNDGDVIEFIEQNRPVMTDDFIKQNISRFREYIRVRDNDPMYTAKLSIFADQVIVNYVPRTEEIQLRIQKGIVTTVKYDSITEQNKGVTMKDYRMEIGNAHAISFLKEFIENYNIKTFNRSMWLCGSFGVGKSLLMAAFCTALKKKGIGVCFYDFNQLTTELLSSMRYDNKKIDQKLKEIKECEILILDDMGSETVSSWSIKTVLHNTLNARYSDKKSTFFTSNLTKEEYYQKLINANVEKLDEMDVQRLKQRINSVAVEIQMTGEDKREKADEIYRQLKQNKAPSAGNHIKE